MAFAEVPLKGVKRRKSSGTDYFEARIPGHGDSRLYCTKIDSTEVGALCYDILQLRSELGVGGEKRKAAVKLNYPEYSRTLQLEPWPNDFDIQDHKEEAMKIILKQAQAAAKNLRESLRRPTPVVGSPCPSNRSSSHQNVHGKTLVAKQDLPGVHTIQLIFQEMSELSHHCNMSYTSKVMEREMLESKVAGINKDSGHIYFPKPLPNKFTDFMARFKQLMTRDEKIPWTLEMAEQGYQSQDSKCLELRKLLEDHNFKVMGSSMDDGNETSGRRRANEGERLPRMFEDFPCEEQNGCGVSVLDSDRYGLPGNPLVDVRPFGTDTTTPPAEMDVSQCVVPHEFDKVADENVVTCETFSVGYPICIDIRREEEYGSLPEEWNDNYPELPNSSWNPDEWIDLSNEEFSHEDPDLLISPPVISNGRPYVQLCETFSVDYPICIGIRQEEEDGSLPEEWNDSYPEMPISLWSHDGF